MPVSRRLDIWRPVVSGCGILTPLVGVGLLVWGLSMMGCAVGYPLKSDGTADTGDAIIGISTGTANAAGAGLLSLGGLLSGNPAIVGLAALVANQMGKRAGWTEYEEDALKKRGVVATTEKSI